MYHEKLRHLLADSKVIFCVGAGGVGKTTTAAALALAAARQGRHCAVLTIDPARRLAQALGLEKMGNVPKAVKEELTAPGSVDAMMLESSDAFDQMIRHLVTDLEKQQRLLKNRLYQIISQHLGGSHEYMAVEKLYSLISDSKYDLVIVDTPPSVNALDFFDAPLRIQNFFSERIQKFFIQREQSSENFFSRLKAKAGDMAVTLLAKALGRQFIQDFQEFSTAFQDLFTAFRLRGEVVQELLSDPKTAFCLVSVPDAIRVAEALEMIRAVKKLKIKIDLVILNRAHLQNSMDFKSLKKVFLAEVEQCKVPLHADEIDIVAQDLFEAHQIWEKLYERDLRGQKVLEQNIAEQKIVIFPEQDDVLLGVSPVEHLLAEIEKDIIL